MLGFQSNDDAEINDTCFIFFFMKFFLSKLRGHSLCATTNKFLLIKECRMH